MQTQNMKTRIVNKILYFLYLTIFDNYAIIFNILLHYIINK